MKKLKTKNICQKFYAYQKRFNAILNHYPKEALVIEGHFHQALKYKNYISLPSLACQGEVAVVRDGHLEFSLVPTPSSVGTHTRVTITKPTPNHKRATIPNGQK